MAVATTPFITVRYYEGKPWQPPTYGSTIPSERGRFVIQKYASIWFGYGVKRSKTYQDYDNDSSVDSITLLTDYPLWMHRTPILNKCLPKDAEDGLTSMKERWARGPALKFYPNYSRNRWGITQSEIDSLDARAKAEFENADALFRKWYPNNEPMPYEPKDNERWFLYRQDD